jgi:hypothetical protein
MPDRVRPVRKNESRFRNTLLRSALMILLRTYQPRRVEILEELTPSPLRGTGPLTGGELFDAESLEGISC